MTFNYDAVQEWELDKTDPMVFASTMFDIRLANFSNNLYDYTNAITKVLTLHMEKFLTSHPPLVDGHGLTAAQQLQRTKDFNCHGHAIHDEFQK